MQRQKEIKLVNQTNEKYEQVEAELSKPSTTHLAEDPQFRLHHLQQENAEFKAHTTYLKDTIFTLSNQHNELERKYQALAQFVKEIL